MNRNPPPLGMNQVSSNQDIDVEGKNCLYLIRYVSVCNNVFSHKRRVDLFAVNPASAYHMSGSVNSVCVCFMLDIGALVNLIRESVWRK